MQKIVLRDLTQGVNLTPVAVALGNFDGVHIGHATLLAAAVKSGYTPAVFTFAGEVPHFLTSEEQKEKELEKSGIALLFSAPFSLFKALSPENFVGYLAVKLSVKHIVCGYNFRFGKNALGTPQLLTDLAKAYGITVEVLPKMTLGGTAVSSSRIRSLLAGGKTEEANVLLGRPYTLEGKVEKGHSMGKKLTFPTVNLAVHPSSAPLKQGVYASLTVIDRKPYPSVTNIGNNPTFHRKVVTCETHILDLSADLYGKEVSVSLLSFLREERKFATPEALSEAIALDVANAVAFHRKNGEGDKT